MKAAIILILMLVVRTNFVEEDGVLMLTVENFESALEHFKYIMVVFHDPQSESSSALTPEYVKVARQLKKADYVAIAKVDATSDEVLANHYDVQEFPTILFFTKTAGIEYPASYGGPPLAADMMKFITKYIGSMVMKIKSLYVLQSLINKLDDTPMAVYFGTAERDDATFAIYKKVAYGFERVKFYYTNDPTARTEYNLEEGERVVLFKSFDDLQAHYTQPMDEVSLHHFLAVQCVQNVLPFNEKAIQYIFQDSNVGLLLFVDDTMESQAAFEVFSDVAAHYRDKIKFTYARANDSNDLFTRLVQYVGANQDTLPSLMLVDPANDNAKYRYEGAITYDKLNTFLTDFLSGTLSRYLKSQDAPPSNNQPLQIIVGSNFNDVVMRNTKDVLIEFYAPWCSHCQQLEPILVELAKRVSHNPNLIIAKCDATVNEIAGVDIKSYPTLRFWRNGEKEIAIPYAGPRDLKGFIRFLKENVSHPWIDVNQDL